MKSRNTRPSQEAEKMNHEDDSTDKVVLVHIENSDLHVFFKVDQVGDRIRLIEGEECCERVEQ